MYYTIFSIVAFIGCFILLIKVLLKNTIYGVPGSIQTSRIDFLTYYINQLFYTDINPNLKLYYYNNNYTTLYGYCCRQLFKNIYTRI